MRLLLTNDDGINAAGLHALVRMCTALGHSVVVVAPSQDLSGASAAIGRIRADQRIDTRRTELEESPDVPAHAIDGPPGLAAMAACLGAFGDPPDAVVSGINAGPNTGHAILHSGTVGAALTAATFGVSALAVSAETGGPTWWDAAAPLVPQALELLASAPVGTVLNLNCPSVSDRTASRLRWAHLDTFGLVRVAVVGTGERWLQMEYRETGAELDPESDTALLANGFATITAIQGIAEVRLDDRSARGATPDRLDVRLKDVPEEETGGAVADRRVPSG